MKLELVNLSINQMRHDKSRRMVLILDMDEEAWGELKQSMQENEFPEVKDASDDYVNFVLRQYLRKMCYDINRGINPTTEGTSGPLVQSP